MNNKYLICLSIIILIILYIILILEKKKEHFTEQEYLDKIEKIIKEEEIPTIDYVICDNLNVKNNANITTLTSNTNNFKITYLNGDTLNSKSGEISNANSKSISNVITKDINLNNNNSNSKSKTNSNIDNQNTKIIINNLDLNNKDINLNCGGEQVKYIDVNNSTIKNYYMPNDNSFFMEANDNDKEKDIINYKNKIYKKLRCKNIKGRDSKTYSIMTY